jgi:hypothetical protein
MGHLQLRKPAVWKIAVISVFRPKQRFLVTDAVRVSGLLVLSTTWKSTDDNAKSLEVRRRQRY